MGPTRRPNACPVSRQIPCQGHGHLLSSSVRAVRGHGEGRNQWGACHYNVRGAPLGDLDITHYSRTDSGNASLIMDLFGSRLRYGLEVLSSRPGIATRAEDWDADPRYISVRGGRLDLATFALEPPTAEHLSRLNTNVRFDPAARSEAWETFLREVSCDDDAWVRFLQRVVGYSLLGNPVEQVWLFLVGQGANGKSVFLSALRHALGEYTATMPFSCLEAARWAGIPNDIARLVGKRLVFAAESSENSKFDPAKLNALTGGEPVTARFMRQEFFEFLPRFVLMLAGNRKPYVTDTSEGFWRRCLVVPFDRFFAPEERDPHLSETLQREAKAILAWAVAGLRDYYERGIAPPDRVLEATAAYRQDCDVLGEFVDAWLKSEPGAFLTTEDAYRAYLAHCAESLIPEKTRMSKRSLSRRLAERFARSSNGRRRGFLNLALARAIPVDDHVGVLPLGV